MLNTVLFARDKWLVPGGLLLPDRVSSQHNRSHNPNNSTLSLTLALTVTINHDPFYISPSKHEQATLYIAAIEDAVYKEEKYDFWSLPANGPPSVCLMFISVFCVDVSMPVCYAAFHHPFFSACLVTILLAVEG